MEESKTFKSTSISELSFSIIPILKIPRSPKFTAFTRSISYWATYLSEDKRYTIKVFGLMTALGPCRNPRKESNLEMILPSVSSCSLRWHSSAQPFRGPEPKNTARSNGNSQIVFNLSAYTSMILCPYRESISISLFKESMTEILDIKIPVKSIAVKLPVIASPWSFVSGGSTNTNELFLSEFVASFPFGLQVIMRW